MTNLLFTSLASEFNNIYQPTIECAKKSYKNILGDYSSDYKSRLLKHVTTMMEYEIYDISKFVESETQKIEL